MATPKIKQKTKAGPKAAGNIKMAELVKRTGVPKSTIIYYVKEGLLPEPERTSPNMAYYDASSVERIKLIKSLQKRYYPLARIKDFIKVLESGGTSKLLMEMDRTVFPGKEVAGKLYARREFLKTTGLSAKALDRAEELKIILPLERAGGKKYDEEDARMGRILAGGMLLGVEIDAYAFYTEFADKISEHEMALRNKVVKEKPMDAKIIMTSMFASAGEEARAYIFRRFLQKRAEAQMKRTDEKNKVKKA